MLLSILIVNYNGLRFLSDCLRSVEQYVRCNHEVIIVDNASSDESIKFIRKNFPNVKLIASEVNTGFTGGNNLAAAAASGDYLLLLNNDTVILSDIQPVIDAFSDASVGIVGAHLQYADRRNQPSAGYEHTPLRLVLSWTGLATISWLPNIFRRVEQRTEFYQHNRRNLDWVSGAFLLTRRVLWRELGGLDERYFMYVEDVDYCRRVKDLGHSIDYVADVHVLHYEGAGKPWIGEAALLRTVTSYSIYLRKYYGPVVTVLTQLTLGLVMATRAVAYQVFILSSTSPILLEKRAAYFKAARFLFKLA